MRELEEIKKRIGLLGIKKSHIARTIGATNVELSHYLSGRRALRYECEKKLNDYLFQNKTTQL